MKECPACHAFNDDDAKFCTACGVYFSRAAEEVQPAAPAAGDGEAQTEMRVTAPQELPKAKARPEPDTPQTAGMPYMRKARRPPAKPLPPSASATIPP